MSSQIPLCLPNLPKLVTQPFNQTLHRNFSTLNLHAWLLEPQQSRSRASLRQWQQGLILLKEDQPDPSEAKWTIFTKWCLSNQVDFRAPPLTAIADFPLYLFQDRSYNQAPLMAIDQPEPCVITWTGPQILGGTRSWSLSLLRNFLIRTSHLPLSSHGSNRL